MIAELNFFNYSYSSNFPDVAVYQKNISIDMNSLDMAWKVIRHCGYGNNHPFVFPYASFISATDSYGNYTPRLRATNGQLFHVVSTHSGNELVYKGPSTHSGEIQLQNDLERGALDANIFKDGRILARKTSIAPGQKAVFQLRPTLFIGAVSQVEEGAALSAANMPIVTTEICLLGVARADILMTGGGAGSDATAFAFHLENVVMA